MTTNNTNGTKSPTGNLVAFPGAKSASPAAIHPDRLRAATDLHHMANLIEQGEVVSAIGVFCNRTDFTAFRFQGGGDEGYDIVRLIGAVAIAHAELLRDTLTSAE